MSKRRTLFEKFLNGEFTLAREDGSEIKPEEVTNVVPEGETEAEAAPEVEVNVEAEGDAEVEVKADADGAEVITTDSELETELVEQAESAAEEVAEVEEKAEDIEDGEEAVATLEALYQNVLMAKLSGTANAIHGDLVCEHLDYVCDNLQLPRTNSNTINLDHESAYATVGMAAITTEGILGKIKDTIVTIFKAIWSGVMFVVNKVGAVFKYLFGLFKTLGQKIASLGSWFKGKITSKSFKVKPNKKLMKLFNTGTNLNNEVKLKIQELNAALDKHIKFIKFNDDIGDLVNKLEDVLKKDNVSSITKNIDIYNKHAANIVKLYGMHDLEVDIKKWKVSFKGISRVPYTKSAGVLLNGKAFVFNDDVSSKYFGRFDLVKLPVDKGSALVDEADAPEEIEVSLAELEQMFSVLEAKYKEAEASLDRNKSELDKLAGIVNKIKKYVDKGGNVNTVKHDEEKDQYDVDSLTNITSEVKESITLIKNYIVSYAATKAKVLQEVGTTFVTIAAFIDAAKASLKVETPEE